MNRLSRLIRIPAILSLAWTASGDAGPLEVPFAAVPDPPAIQMLVPGFTVRELPLDLNNINNLVYAPDGRLFALAYDGDVLQLKDTDGDGLEDTSSLFFKNDENQIPPSIGMAWGPGGLYIASQKRVIRLRDKGDGTGELQTITEGWAPPTGKAGSSLDSIGIAVDGLGNIYFGLGCDNWHAAYRVDKETGKSEYDIHSERGTILKVSPDWKKREAIATGLRFAVSLAFNAQGDMFCTDQEGATWLPNGNPFDELLQIQPGRHYGFPPRHPKYLPSVIDEPSVYDFAPQHQSTCGLHFNEPVGGSQAVFGPSWWRGDAFVSGESRGKIWRTKLVKTSAGYVAQTELLACLSMMTVDAVPTPHGDLIVTCHSGKPDWGTGPKGKGKLFKISHTGTETPQPVFAYAESPTETRVVFDRPLDPSQFKNLAEQSHIVMGRYVTAGERYETFRPGYQAVKNQMDVPRYRLDVLAAGISPDNRSIILQTSPRIHAMNYGVTLPEFDRKERAHEELKHELAQRAGMDVLADLTGVEVDWKSARGDEHWHGWLPHLDLDVSRTFTAPSAEHAHLFEQLKHRGELALRTQLDAGLMLHPATQPGEKLDYEYPPEIVTFVIRGATKFKLKAGKAAKVKRIKDDEYQVTVSAAENHWLPLEITMPTSATGPRLEINWHTAEDPRMRAMPLRRFFMPWAAPQSAEALVARERQVPEIAGGDWERGRKVFFGEQTACYKCHEIRGEGGKIGPNLSNLPQRDYASVLKDIVEPSAAINPDNLAYNVTMKDDESVTGVLMDNNSFGMVLGLANGTTLFVDKNRIANAKASSVSLMPEGLLKGLSAKQQKDLLMFLLTEPPPTSARK